MPDYTKKTDEDLIHLNEIYGDWEAGDELENRGYVQTRKGEWVEIYEPFVTSRTLLFFAGVIALLAGLFCTHFILGYSTNYTIQIWVGFVVSLVLMILTRGRSKFFNFIFYLGCFALLTRLFVNIIEYSEGQSYMSFLFEDETTDLIVLIKYGLFYAIYIFFAPYLLMKYGTSYVRLLRKAKPIKNKSLNI